MKKDLTGTVESMKKMYPLAILPKPAKDFMLNYLFKILSW